MNDFLIPVKIAFANLIESFVAPIHANTNNIAAPKHINEDPKAVILNPPLNR